MKKFLCLFICIFVISFLLISCTRDDNNEEIETSDGLDLEYEIINKDDIPQKMKEKIFEKQSKEFGFTYRNGKELYIAIGYGTQPSSGYSIKIISLKENENRIIFSTELIEPAKEEVVAKVVTYPYIVIKTKDTGLDVKYNLN